MEKAQPWTRATETPMDPQQSAETAPSPLLMEPLQVGDEGMMAEERRTQILQLVVAKGRVRVNELAQHFATSAVTIRNDLNELHQRGRLLRSHGGAVAPDSVLRESPLYERMMAHSQEKRRIGTMAATLINSGETIILDSGTTT